MIEVACISMSRGAALTEDGQELPVTHCFDGDGDDCEPDDAIAAVAGPDRDGLWLQINLSAFDDVVMQ